MQMPEKFAEMSDERKLDFKMLDMLKEMKRTKKAVVKALKKSLKRNGSEIKDVNKMIKRYNKISPQSTENLKDLLSNLESVKNYFDCEISESMEAIRELKRNISELTTVQQNIATKEQELKALVEKEKYYRERFNKLLPIKRENITMKQVDQRSNAHTQFKRAQNQIKKLENELSIMNDQYLQMTNTYAQYKENGGPGFGTSNHGLSTKEQLSVGLSANNRSTSCSSPAGQRAELFENKEMQSDNVIQLDKATETGDFFKKLDSTEEPKDEIHDHQETTNVPSNFYDQGDSAKVCINVLPV